MVSALMIGMMTLGRIGMMILATLCTPLLVIIQMRRGGSVETYLLYLRPHPSFLILACLRRIIRPAAERSPRQKPPVCPDCPDHYYF